MKQILTTAFLIIACPLAVVGFAVALAGAILIIPLAALAGDITPEAK